LQNSPLPSVRGTERNLSKSLPSAAPLLRNRRSGVSASLRFRLQLESAAKVRLRPLLSRLGLSVVEDEPVRREGEARAERVAAQSWSATLREWDPWIAQAIRDYQALARTAPAEDQETLEYMVRHEQDLAAFLAGELAERGAAALAPVLDFLSYPLPRGSQS
jgi:hypothetical protein